MIWLHGAVMMGAEAEWDYLSKTINFKIRDDIKSVLIPHIFESLFIEMKTKSRKNTIVGVTYGPNTAPKADVDIFSATTCMFNIMDNINKENKIGVIMGDMNIDLLKIHLQTDQSDQVLCNSDWSYLYEWYNLKIYSWYYHNGCSRSFWHLLLF